MASAWAWRIGPFPQSELESPKRSSGHCSSPAAPAVPPTVSLDLSDRPEPKKRVLVGKVPALFVRA
jgi:hypothetical protein